LLDFIYSLKKKEEMENILFDRHPNHNQRLFFTGFANYCGLSKKDIDKLIKNYSNWDDFNEIENDKHTASICKEPRFFSEDFSFVNHKDDVPQYRRCCDTSIFSKLNKDFFDMPDRTSYEYAPQKYNVWGSMKWQPIQFPIYRTIEGKEHLLYYIDVDGHTDDIELCYNTANDIFELDTWDYYKFSGSKGFHLAKKIKNKTRYDLKEMAYEVYKTIKTNLIGFGTANQVSKPILIDTTAYNHHRFVRGFSKNYKGGYSYPVHTEMNAKEIIEISRDLNRIEEFLK